MEILFVSLVLVVFLFTGAIRGNLRLGRTPIGGLGGTGRGEKLKLNTHLTYYVGRRTVQTTLDAWVSDGEEHGLIFAISEQRSEFLSVGWLKHTGFISAALFPALRDAMRGTAPVQHNMLVRPYAVGDRVKAYGCLEPDNRTYAWVEKRMECRVCAEIRNIGDVSFFVLYFEERVARPSGFELELLIEMNALPKWIEAFDHLDALGPMSDAHRRVLNQHGIHDTHGILEGQIRGHTVEVSIDISNRNVVIRGAWEAPIGLLGLRMHHIERKATGAVVLDTKNPLFDQMVVASATVDTGTMARLLQQPGLAEALLPVLHAFPKSECTHTHLALVARRLDADALDEALTSFTNALEALSNAAARIESPE